MTLQQSILFALQASIMLTVIGFGLQARREDVLDVVERPGRLARSFLAMFILMPVLAVLLARRFELRPEVEIALVVLSISPLPPHLMGSGLRPQLLGRTGRDREDRVQDHRAAPAGRDRVQAADAALGRTPDPARGPAISWSACPTCNGAAAGPGRRPAEAASALAPKGSFTWTLRVSILA